MYSESIFDTEPGVCFLCGRWCDTARHEIFHGAFRKRSQALGLWVNLCPYCHAEVHQTDGNLDRYLKAMGQETAEIYYGWDTDDFRLIFGRNYE